MAVVGRCSMNSQCRGKDSLASAALPACEVRVAKILLQRAYASWIGLDSRSISFADWLSYNCSSVDYPT